MTEAYKYSDFFPRTFCDKRYAEENIQAGPGKLATVCQKTATTLFPARLFPLPNAVGLSK